MFQTTQAFRCGQPHRLRGAIGLFYRLPLAENARGPRLTALGYLLAKVHDVWATRRKPSRTVACRHLASMIFDQRLWYDDRYETVFVARETLLMTGLGPLDRSYLMSWWTNGHTIDDPPIVGDGFTSRSAFVDGTRIFIGDGRWWRIASCD